MYNAPITVPHYPSGGEGGGLTGDSVPIVTYHQYCSPGGNSTRRTGHSDHETLTVVHLWSHTQTHIDNHELFEYQIYTVSSLGHLVSNDSINGTQLPHG